MALIWTGAELADKRKMDDIALVANPDPACKPDSSFAVRRSAILRAAPTARSNSHDDQAGNGGDYAYLYGRGLGWRNNRRIGDRDSFGAWPGQGRRYVRSLGAYLARSLGDDDNAVAVFFDTVLVFAIGTVIYLGYLAACALTE